MYIAHEDEGLSDDLEDWVFCFFAEFLFFWSSVLLMIIKDDSGKW